MTQATELRELASLLRVHDGKIGIGPLTANPPYTLSLGQTNVAGAHTIRLAGSGNPKHEIQFREAGTSYGFTFRYAGDAADNKLHIVAHENDANGTEAISIKRDGGNVGIRNIAPSATLEVGTLTSGETGNVIINSEGGNPVGLRVASRTNRARIQVADNDTSGFIIAEGSIFSLGFADQASDNNVNITNAYDVGIGTQTPAHKLDVVGAIGVSQVRHSVSPTLNLDFANSKQLDPMITFYRDSVATYYDSKGIIRYANHNEPRFDHDPITSESKGLLIEESRENIAQATTLELPIDFNNMHVEGSKYYEIAPDGTYSGHRVIASPGVSRHEVNIKYPGTSGVVYTGSTWVKPLGAVTHFNVSRAGGSDMVRFVLTGNGSIDAAPGGTASGTIAKGNKGWYKISITFTEASTGSARSIYMSPGAQAGSSSVYSNLTGDGINGVALWGSQVEQGAFATSYVPLNTRFTSRSTAATYHDEYGVLQTAPANTARYGYKYNGRKWIETGLILEKTATNLFTESNFFEGSSWSIGRQNISISKDSTGNPDGNTNTRFMSANSQAGSWILKNVTLSSGTFYTTSVYAKQKSSGINVQIAPSTGFSSTYQNFNLSTGELGSGNLTNDQRATMEDVGNGWYRCSVTGQANATNGRMAIAMVNGDDARLQTVPNASALYIFGTQFESNRGPTSFIYTEGATKSRSADVMTSSAYTRKADDAYIDNIQNYDWYSHDSGTLFAEHNVDRDIDGSAWGIVTLENEGSSDNYVGLRYRSSGTSGEVLNLNGISQISASSIPAADLNYFNKGAIAYETNSAAAVGNGGTVSTDSSVTIPNLTRMTIGDGYAINYIGGHIKKIAYYSERLSNVEIQALTENN